MFLFVGVYVWILIENVVLFSKNSSDISKVKQNVKVMKTLKKIAIFLLTVISSVSAQAQIELLEVWPGDANDDGYVNIEDVFTIGRYWGREGYSRYDLDIDIEQLNVDTIFIGEDTIVWDVDVELWEALEDYYVEEGDTFYFVDSVESGFYGEWYIDEEDWLDSIEAEEGLDQEYIWYSEYALPWYDHNDKAEVLAFADADGDGEIAYGDFGMVYQFYDFETEGNRSIQDVQEGLPVSVNYLQDSIVAGEEFVAEIVIGNSNLVAEDLYAVGFSLDFNLEMIQTEESFIETDDQLLGEENFPFAVMNQETGEVQFAITKLGGNGVDATGMVARVSTVIEDNIIGEMDKIDVFKFDLKDVVLYTQSGTVIPSTTVDEGVSVRDTLSSVTEYENPSIVTYPNPAKEDLNILIDQTQVTAVSILNILGTEVFQTQTITGNLKINVSDWAEGVYFVQFKGENRIGTKRIVIE